MQKYFQASNQNDEYNRKLDMVKFIDNLNLSYIEFGEDKIKVK